MIRVAVELVRRGVRAQRRSTVWWTLGIVALALVTVAFWPGDDVEALREFEESISPEVLQAFGAQNFSTPAGYLDAQLYALLLPLLLSGFAAAAASALTSDDEDAGRLELLHALPVHRQSLWAWRFASAAAVVAAAALASGLVVVATVGAFGLDVAAGRIAAVTVACLLLAVFHGAVAYAVGGFGGSRGLAIGGAILVLLAGYVLSFLFPLADAVASLQRASPWYWALGQQPVSDGVSWPGVALLAGVTAAVAAAGTIAVGRRDIRSA